MSISTIITWLLGLWNALKGGSSSRVKLEVRSEKSIEDDRERIDKLYSEMLRIDNDLKVTIHRIVWAKQDGDTALESRLNDKRDMLFEQFKDAKREYDNAKRHSD